MGRHAYDVRLWRSLRLRLPLLIALLIGGVLAVYLSLAYREVRSSLLRSGGDRAQAAADQIANLFAPSVEQRIQGLRHLTTDSNVRAFLRQPTPDGQDGIRRLLEASAGVAPERYELWTPGHVRLLDVQTVGSNRSSPPPEIPGGEAPTATGIKPLRSLDNRLVFSEAVSSVFDDQPVAGGTPALLGFLLVRGTFSINPPGVLQQLVGRDARVAIGNQTGGVWTDLAQAIPTPPVDLAHRGVREYRNTNGDAVLGAATPIANTPWAAWVEFPESTIVKPAQTLLRRMAMLGAAILIAGVALVAVVSLGVTRPLRDLSGATARIAKGDFSLQLTSKRTDEIGQLTDAFNTMTAEVRSAYGALKRNDEHTQFALTAAHMGVWESDVAADRVVWSESMAKLFGLSLEQAPRTTGEFLALVHTDDRPQVRDSIARAMSERMDQFLLEYRVLTPDGAVRWIEASARVLYGNMAQPESMLGVAVDVTERKALETQLRQAQKMEAIGQLAGGVAHDFNNLLTAILGYARLLADTLSEDDVRRSDLKEIDDAGERAAGLTRQLLAFSRQQILQPTTIDLNALITSTSDMLRRVIGEHIELATDLAADLAPVVADKTQLEQVIINLSVNARDAMPGGGRLSITTANVDLDNSYAMTHVDARAGRYVMLAVSDTGVGMNEATKRRLFEPFFTTKELGKGTGLGLATVYGIVKQSGGYIWVYSEPGRGASFKVYLPPASETGVESSTVPKPSSRVAGGNETVLVVEDEAAVRYLARMILERAGYRVLDAANPEAAESQPLDEIDLMITDVIMPGSTGPAMFAKLSATRPHLKVLFMSGYTDDMIAHGGELNPETAFLQKPFTNEGLLRKVREVLDR